VTDPEDDISPSVEDALTRRGGVKVHDWDTLWKMLFPDDEIDDIPEPGIFPYYSLSSRSYRLPLELNSLLTINADFVPVVELEEALELARQRWPDLLFQLEQVLLQQGGEIKERLSDMFWQFLLTVQENCHTDQNISIEPKNR
jgi:hypothetical protein